MSFRMLMPEKPELGAPCNGCGVCCARVVCALAIMVDPSLGRVGPCPHLKWELGRAWCGLALLEPAVLGVLGDGTCDSGPDFGPDRLLGEIAGWIEGPEC